MKENPLVSIVVPTFNQGHYLPMALDSVMFQDYEPIELIICNHGSTDGTTDVIERYLHDVEHGMVSYLGYYNENDSPEFIRKQEKKFPHNRHIKIIEGKTNIGGTNSYNKGFEATKGTYCTYLVADDYFYPGAIKKMVNALERNNADVVFSDMYVVDDMGRILQRLSKPAFDFEKSLADWFHLGVSRLYRRALHDDVGFYDPEYRNANDYDMFLRFAIAGARFVHIPEVLYGTRKHYPDNPDEPASWRNNGYENLLRESKRCAGRARRYLKESGGKQQ